MCHLESVFEDLHISTHFTRFYNVEKIWGQCMVIYQVIVAKFFSCCKMFCKKSKDIVQSFKVLYGEEEEELMANSPIGSTIRTIWDEKNVNDYC